MTDPKLVDLDLKVVHQTEKAFLLTDGREDANGDLISEWVAKANCENNNDGTFTMPEWSAIEKGFV